MKIRAMLCAVGALSALLAGAAATGSSPARAAEAKPPAPCTTEGKLNFICGVFSVEDLVAVPGGRWIIGSSFQLGSSAPKSAAGLYLIDVKARSARPAKVVGGQTPTSGPFAGCAAPDVKALNSHGLELRPGKGGVHTLYAVNHSGRESIEVFSLDDKGAEPVITWSGCVVLPEGVNGNSVAALPNGGLAVTKFQTQGAPGAINTILSGAVTGTVYVWTPGKGFKELEAARLSGDNGITASPDGKFVYVNAYGGKAVVRIALDGKTPAKTADVGFRPDNIRWTPDGKLLATGQYIEPDTLRGPHGWGVMKIDPQTMATTLILKQAALPAFDNATTALQVGKELWIGTYAGDRIIYTPVG